MKKKYVLHLSLIVLFIISVSFVYLSCEDQTLGTFDLTGRWTGWGRASDGGGHVELDVVQDTTTGNVSGFVYVSGEKVDTLPFFGTVSEGHFTGIGYSECRPTIDLDVKNDGTKLEGSARDIDSASCNTASVELLFYKVMPAAVDVSGNWTGTHSGTDGSGNFTMSLTQDGGNVTGTIFENSDQTPISGRIIGNVFEATLADQDCSIMILMEANNNKMSGKYESCGDRGTVTTTRASGKR